MRLLSLGGIFWRLYVKIYSSECILGHGCSLLEDFVVNMHAKVDSFAESFSRECQS